MQVRGMTEQEAHRFLQSTATKQRQKLAELAKIVCEAGEIRRPQLGLILPSQFADFLHQLLNRRTELIVKRLGRLSISLASRVDRRLEIADRLIGFEGAQQSLHRVGRPRVRVDFSLLEIFIHRANHAGGIFGSNRRERFQHLFVTGKSLQSLREFFLLSFRHLSIVVEGLAWLPPDPRSCAFSRRAKLVRGRLARIGLRSCEVAGGTPAHLVFRKLNVSFQRQHRS